MTNFHTFILLIVYKKRVQSIYKTNKYSKIVSIFKLIITKINIPVPKLMWLLYQTDLNGNKILNTYLWVKT